MLVVHTAVYTDTHKSDQYSVSADNLSLVIGIDIGKGKSVSEHLNTLHNFPPWFYTDLLSGEVAASQSQSADFCWQIP